MASDVNVPEEQDAVERKRKDQGCHECEVFGHQPGAMESERTWTGCRKNPGHVKFIPYPKLCMEHLPEDVRTQEILNRIKMYADRTVRLRVGYTSVERPKGFPFHNVRGTNLVHTGSGWIDHIPLSNIPPIRRFRAPRRACIVRRYPGHPCPCPECANRISSSPPLHRTWYEVHVTTACHVVYDKEEAKATKVDIFYDDESSEFNGTMKTIWGFDVVHDDLRSDTCILRCVSLDYKIIEQITHPRMRIVYGASLQRLLLSPLNRDVCVVVSHPHGQPKQVTIGEMLRGVTEPGAGWLAYTTGTCPGSSGAPVLCMERNLNPSSEIFVPDAVHSMGDVAGAWNQGSSYLKVIKN